LPSGIAVRLENAVAASPASIVLATLLAADDDANTADDALSISTIEIDDELLATLADPLAA
jgi:hypothetical protein